MKYELEYIVVYDIQKDKIRTKVFERLKDFGLIPVQKSAFLGLLNKAELRELKAYLKETLEENDKCLILCGQYTKQIKQFAIGYNLEELNLYKLFEYVC